MVLASLFDPLVVAVSRQEVESGLTTPALSTLRKLMESPELARSFFERVEVTFFGYDNDPRELFEIDEVRSFVRKIDDEFPFWLFFLSKRHTGLQCLMLCKLPPFLTEEGRSEIFPKRISELLTKRWFPAMNQTCEYAGLSETEIRELTDRVVKYITNGPLPLVP